MLVLPLPCPSAIRTSPFHPVQGLWGYMAGATHLPSAALLSGCTQGVYIDIGLNVGEMLRVLYEPSAAQAAKGQGRQFSEFFGANRSEVCTIGLEPNPAHARQLSRLAGRLRAATLCRRSSVGRPRLRSLSTCCLQLTTGTTSRRPTRIGHPAPDGSGTGNDRESAKSVEKREKCGKV